MSVTDFFDLNILEQDDDTQKYNFVKGISDSFNFNNTIWVPSALVPPSLNPLTLPALPTLFVYIKNIGLLNIGLQITPFAASGGGGSPPSVAVNLLGPGSIFLLSVPNLGGAGMLTAGGPFPATVTAGLQSIFLEASSTDPTANGIVEYFLGG